MPLMSSPIDGSPMREIERYGVKIDICPTSGGIWLDKGELEKIIMMIREEALEDGRSNATPQAQSFDRTSEYQDDQRGYDNRPRGKKRDGIFDNLMDMFDF